MGWHVVSRTEPNRWVVFKDRAWAADEETADDLMFCEGQRVRLTPDGPYYEPTGPDDEVCLFLWACRLIPDEEVSGDPPDLPKLPSVDDEAVH